MTINMDEFCNGKRGHDTSLVRASAFELIRAYGIRVSWLGVTTHGV